VIAVAERGPGAERTFVVTRAMLITCSTVRQVALQFVSPDPAYQSGRTRQRHRLLPGLSAQLTPEVPETCHRLQPSERDRLAGITRDPDPPVDGSTAGEAPLPCGGEGSGRKLGSEPRAVSTANLVRWRLAGLRPTVCGYAAPTNTNR
jgi:hypothetical protein